MSRFFDDAAGEHLINSNAAVPGVPLSLSCWIYSDDAATNQTIMSIGQAGTSHYFALWAAGNFGADQILAATRDAVSSVYAQTTVGYSTTAWHHVCGVYPATNLRYAFIDGGHKGSEVTDVVPQNLDTTYISRLTWAGFEFSGRLAEAAIWNVALTDNEVLRLAQGRPPWDIYPNHLVGFWLPFADRTDRDFSGRGFHMSAVNTPTWAPDPPRVIARYRTNRHHHTDDKGAPWWRILTRRSRLPRYGFVNFQIPGVV